MATYIVTTAEAASPGDGTLSLAAAIALAELTPEDDVIKFAEGLLPAAFQGQPFVTPEMAMVRLGEAITITGAGGAITIIGDRDGDGISDMSILAGEGHHFTIQAGAKVNLVNVDLIGSSFRGRPNGEAGAHGEDGAPGTRANTLVGRDGADGDDSAKDGTPGEDGTNGAHSVGAILNYGELTLERVGFGLNRADGGRGGDGGFGGRGGIGSGGADGFQDSFDTHPLLQGGNGGNGGPGGDGADGGRGGDGGDAAGAILNYGVVNMVDVAFGGRLSTGLLARGNEAFGGHGGLGGQGGSGGFGGAGGEGGRYGAAVSGEGRHEFHATETLTFFFAYRSVDTSRAGVGGNGGDGGNGGSAGRNGDGGSAATILNFGSLTGKAAFVEGGGETGMGNHAVVGRGDFFTPLSTGSPGLGGPAGNGGWERESWREWTGESAYPVSSSASWLPAYEAWVQSLPPYLSWRPSEHPEPTERAASGMNGANGEFGAPGVLGVDGTASTTILDRNTVSDVEAAASLVYLYGIGQTGEKLAFNIIRTGDITADLTVGWRIVGHGAQAVDAADFVGGVLPTGTATLEGMAPTVQMLELPTFELAKNVVRVEVDIARDLIDEPPEGYRIELFDLSNPAAAMLGTATFAGTLIDGDGSPDTIFGTHLDDVLAGTGANNRIYGLAGNDVLIGGGGNDFLDGGSGSNVLYGGSGDNTMVVRSVDDTVVVSAVFAPDMGFGGHNTVISHANVWVDWYWSADEVIIAEDNPHAISGIIHGGTDGILVGNSGADILFGFGGNVTYKAGDGVDFLGLNRFLPGDEGVHTVVVEVSAEGFSWDVVYAFETGTDVIDISAYGYGSREEALAFAYDDGASGFYVMLGDLSRPDILYLADVGFDQIDAVDFVV